MQKPIKPSEYARREITRNIIKGVWEPGSNLISERKLSKELGVTRTTLREVLKLLEKEGWIKISPGKPTLVKNFWEEGGLGILSALNENKDLFPSPLIYELLCVRVDILPVCAKNAFEKNPEEFKLFIQTKIHGSVDTKPEKLTQLDWLLQARITSLSENRVYKFIYNEFKDLFLFFGKIYFAEKRAVNNSINYYNALKNLLEKNKNPEKIVKKAMEDSIKIWKQLNNNRNI